MTLCMYFMYFWVHSLRIRCVLCMSSLKNGIPMYSNSYKYFSKEPIKWNQHINIDFIYNYYCLRHRICSSISSKSQSSNYLAIDACQCERYISSFLHQRIETSQNINSHQAQRFRRNVYVQSVKCMQKWWY